MNKLLPLFLFLCCSVPAWAQEVVPEQEEPYFEDWQAVYVRVGINRAGGTGFGADQRSLERLTSAHVGLGATTSLHSSDRLWLNGEVDFSQQGFRFRDITTPTDPEYLKLNYITVPVLVKYFPLTAAPNFYIGAGPQLGFRVGEHVQTKGGGDFQLKDNGLEKIDIAAVGVAGVHFAHLANLGIEVRYQHGFTKILTEVPVGRHSVYQFSFFFPAKIIQRVLNVLAFPFKQ